MHCAFLRLSQCSVRHEMRIVYLCLILVCIKIFFLYICFIRNLTLSSKQNKQIDAINSLNTVTVKRFIPALHHRAVVNEFSYVYQIAAGSCENSSVIHGEKISRNTSVVINNNFFTHRSESSLGQILNTKCLKHFFYPR